MATVLTPNIGDWDLTPFYPERLGADYRNDRQSFRDRLEQALQETDLVQLLIQWEQLVSDSEHMSSYLLCLRSADGRDQQVAQELASLQSDSSRMRQLEVGLGEQLKVLSQAQLEELLKNAQLKDLDYYLNRLRQRALWQMPSELEHLAAELDVDGMSAWGRLYDQLGARLEFQYQDEQGQTHTRPMSMKVSLLEDPCAKVRKSVLEGSNRAWQSVEDVAAACLNAIAGTRLTLYKRRGIPHFLEPALFDSAIERATLDSMLGAIASRYDIPRGFLKLKAKILGVERLGFQDLSAPLPDLDNSKIAYEQAAKMLVEETRASYPEFSKFCADSIAKKWVDWSPREGKRPGGYCTGSSRLRESRIFMTYHGAFGDLMTLTHEFGHAWHSQVMQTERPLNTLYPMTLAETASTFAENLLLDALLRSPATTREQRLKLLDSRLEGACAFLLNIPSRFIFEKSFYEERAQGEVSVDRLKELMLAAQKEAYGDSLDPNQLDPYFWASKLHFYITEVSFYNFPYSFGYLFSLGVYAQAQKRGEAFLPTYERLLQATGRRTAEQCARENLQVELNQPQFWLDSLALVEDDMRQFQELARDVYKIA
jgi:oligoendopeptidase F